MSMLLIGLNHHTAPVAVRERLAFSREGAATALALFKRRYPQAEAAIVSTCNRVEMLINGGPSAAEILRFIADVRGVAVEQFETHMYAHAGRDAIRHVFRVVSGLDSIVVGEYQIVNQLKQAYQLAHEHETAGPTLHRLFHHAFGVSKRVRSETGICDGKTSIPSVAVDVLRRTVPDFAMRRILLAGAGEMARLTAEYLRDEGATNFVVATRTLINAKALASLCEGRAVPFAELDEQLVAADIVITATSCPTAILTAERIGRAQEKRGYRPLTLIDLSVPRNIDPAVAAVPGVTWADVDALGRIVSETGSARAAATRECGRIIEEEIAAFERWVEEAKVRPLLEQMLQDVREMAEIELRSTLQRCPDLKEHQKAAVCRLVEQLVGKLMHPCVTTVRQQVTAAEGFAGAFRAAKLGSRGKCTAAAAAAAGVTETANTNGRSDAHSYQEAGYAI